MTNLRARQDQRRLWLSVLLALIFYGVLFFAGWLYNRLLVKDIGAWTGPMLIKIGTPQAPPSPRQEPAFPREDPAPEPLPPGEPPLDAAPPEPSAGSPPETQAPAPPAREASSQVLEEESSSLPPAPAPPAAAAPAPSPPASLPSQVKGEEDGNSYEMNFDGSPEEVGRAGAYDFIANYLPLPSSLSESLVDGARDYMGKSAGFIQGEISRHWELNFQEWLKKSPVPLADRPYYWSLLSQSLGHQRRQSGELKPRPVVIEFTVLPSQGSRGAELKDLRVVQHTSDPQLEEGVIYGLSRWVYYNKTGRKIKGRITYRFED